MYQRIRSDVLHHLRGHEGGYRKNKVYRIVDKVWGRAMPCRTCTVRVLHPLYVDQKTTYKQTANYHTPAE